MGGSSLTNHGHIQVYLDHIPSDAHRQVDLKGVIANIASPDFSLGLPPQLVTSKRGRHRLLVAIARNDYLLYPVKPAVITVTFQ